MNEANTVQRIVRPITIRCGGPSCDAKSDAVAMSSGEGDEIVAPRGWRFKTADPRSTRDVIVGVCPLHTNS
jgi:hypothetical protein